MPVVGRVCEYVDVHKANTNDHISPQHTFAKMANSRKMGPNVKVNTEYKTLHPKDSQHNQIFYSLKQKRQQILGDRHLKNCIWRTDKQHMGHKQNAVAILLIKIAQPDVFLPFSTGTN